MTTLAAATRVERMAAWTRRHRLLVDAGLAGAFWLVFGAYTIAASADPPHSGSWVATGAAVVAITVAHAAGVFLRRRRPVLAFWIVVTACVAQLLVMDTFLPTDVAVGVVAYGVARWSGSPRWRLAAWLPILASGPLATVDWSPEAAGPSFVASSVSTLAYPALAWVWGDLNRKRAAYVTRLSEANAALVRDRAQREALAAQTERTRIAREMHDIVAHSLSVIVVQADGAAYAAEHASGWDRTQARAALATVGATAREALAETRRLVGVLREEGSGAEYVPAQGLTEIGDLVGGVRVAGLDAHLEVVGDPSVPREVARAAYRIAQEALTNVLRHAGPRAEVTVRLEAGERLTLLVEDDGRGGAAIGLSDGVGNGLIGMRERAAAVGGTVTAGPRPGGGWRVRAELPLKERS